MNATEAVLNDIDQRFQDRRFLLVAEISNYLEISPRTVQGLINRGELEGFKFGKEYRIQITGFKNYVIGSSSIIRFK